MPEILDIINIDDVVIGQATREEIYEKKLIHRVTHVMVRDSNGRFLLQRRAAHISSPLHWIASACGHVQSGESYSEAAIRELAEEVGIIGSDVRELGKFFFDGNGTPKMMCFFEIITDDEPTFDPTEVDSIQFLTPDEAHEHITHGEKNSSGIEIYLGEDLRWKSLNFHLLILR